MPGDSIEQLAPSMSSLQHKFRKIWDDSDSSFDCAELEDLRLSALSHWNRMNQQRDCNSSSESSIVAIPCSSANAVDTKADELGESNNSSQGLEMLNLPSQAEVLAKQRSWMNVYFRYRIMWHQAKPHLMAMSKKDAYLPHNLKLWTRYVKVSLQRNAPLINAVRVFKNRLRCPDIMVRYTLNSFYHKGSEAAKVKNAGPLHPIPLQLFRCPNDFPEIMNMPVATMNIFVTTEEAFFDKFWKECSGGGH